MPGLHRSVVWRPGDLEENAMSSSLATERRGEGPSSLAGASGFSPEGGQEMQILAAELVREPQPAMHGDQRCPADWRIESFLNAHFADLVGPDWLRLPAALELLRQGISRE